mmetsp:Transcript_83224/g.209781  ORF Transcript_83224/g.209781 Transcript_83224/m.209781 type:complete len:208 (-) Transcript_83224:1758-2381(-)
MPGSMVFNYMGKGSKDAHAARPPGRLPIYQLTTWGMPLQPARTLYENTWRVYCLTSGTSQNVKVRRRHARHPEAIAPLSRATAMFVFERYPANLGEDFVRPTCVGDCGKKARLPPPGKPRSPSESCSEGGIFVVASPGSIATRASSGMLTCQSQADANGLWHLGLSPLRPKPFILELGGLHATPSIRMLLNSRVSFSISASLAIDSL